MGVVEMDVARTTRVAPATGVSSEGTAANKRRPMPPRLLNQTQNAAAGATDVKGKAGKAAKSRKIPSL